MTSRRKSRLVAVLLIIGIGAAGYAAYSARQGEPRCSSDDGYRFDKTGQALTADGPAATFELETADTDAERIRGLSGRDCLHSATGMLFVYDQPGRHCMWMKDMKFSLDMIWLDEDKRVVHMATDVKPETYPATSFCSDRPAHYVLELPAGAVERQSLHTGQQFSF